MFWKKQQPALRMVTGRFMFSHTYVLRLIMKKTPTTKPTFYVEWNGEPFSIEFEGFGYITVWTVPHCTVPRLRTILIEHNTVDGVNRGLSGYQDYHNFARLDALEQHIQEMAKESFIAHGIDPKSYSLDELRIAGHGMERGWKLREEFEEGKGE